MRAFRVPAAGGSNLPMSSSTPSPGDESVVRPHVHTSFWSDVAHALKGEQHDYTKESLNRAVLLLAVPMVLEMVMESLFAVVDVFWVSRLGRDAIAVVGITEAVMSLIYAVAIGISFAATAIVARRIGEKDPERAAHSAAQIVMLGVTLSAGLGVLFGWFAPDILRLMGATPADRRGRRELHAHHARRQRHGVHDLPDQRDLPRRRRRGDRDAHVVARERAQHRARSVLHLRLGPVPRAGRDGCGRRHQHRPRRRRALSAVAPGGPQQPHPASVCSTSIRHST